MATLEGFLDELIGVVRVASGIRYAPDDPPSQIATTPAAIVWLLDSRVIGGPSTIVEYHHTVRVGLLTTMQNIAVANQVILPRIEPVIEAIWQKLLADRFGGNVDGFGGNSSQFATYTYGPVQWGEVWYFGAVIDLEDVKIQRTL